MTEASLIQIKGIRDGLLITLENAPWEEVHQALLDHIASQQPFFKGARLALDVGAQALKVAELSGLRDQLSECGISLWAVLSESPTTENTAQLLGLATRITRPHAEEYSQPAAAAVDDKTALWVEHTLRSGTRIEFPGHVVIIGDVNPGAEIAAGGSILIWGRLRGTVRAGMQGDTQAVVAALELAASQVSIADASTSLQHHKGPTRVKLADGQITAEPWHSG